MAPLYTPLDVNHSEIRILTLLPGDPADPVHCTLQTVSLDDSPHFDALSYVWGDLEDQRQLFVEGQPTSVTINLEGALRALRDRAEGQPHSLWADALCINQHDIPEKSTQVPLMGAVYSRASTVFVWLSEPTLTMEIAASWLADIDNDEQNAFDAILKMEELELLDTQIGFQEIAHNPYWRRMWTLQEYQLAKTAPMILCGRAKFSSAHLQKANEALQNRILHSDGDSTPHTEPDPDALDIRRHRFLQLMESAEYNEVVLGFAIEWRKSEISELFQLLLLKFRRQCLDPRDHIYALYGLAPDVRKVLPPDYSKPERKVMHETTAYLVRWRSKSWGGSMWFFSLYDDRLVNDQYPSWTVDFSTTPQEGSEHQYAPRSEMYISDAPTFEIQAPLSVLPGERVLGLRAPSIGTCSVALRFHDNIPDILENLKMVSNRARPRKGRSTLATPIIQAITAHSDMLYHLESNLIKSLLLELETDKSQWRHPLTPRLEECLLQLCFKTFFMTSEHRFGISVADVEVGDVVVASPQIKCPLILRLEKRDWDIDAGHTASARVVGLAYVDGLMNNECVDKKLVDDIAHRAQETFLIH